MQKSYLIGANTIVPDYFCVTPKNGATEVSWAYTHGSNTPRELPLDMEYSFNKLSWTKYTVGTTITTSAPIYFRGKNPRLGYDPNVVSDWGQYKLVLNNICDLSGRLSSIVTKFPKLSATCKLIRKVFSTNTYIRSIKDLELDLTITTYRVDDYSYMFNGCTSLIDTPKFVSDLMTVTASCQCMFENCTSLETLPKLKAITLAQACYQEMFKGCSKIKISTTQTGEYQNAFRIPETGTGVDATNSCYHMFENTGGTFTGTPDINTTYYTSNEVI